MGVGDRMWDAFATVIRMNDKVERVATTVKIQQEKIENLTWRVIRLETALEMVLAGRSARKTTVRQIEHKD
jgi:hypothetical protein